MDQSSKENRYIAADRSVFRPKAWITGEENRVAEFDRDQLERLMVAAFELLGKPEGQAQELARSSLKAAERPQSGDQESLDRAPRRLV
jgi:hypothetical protein